MELTPDFYVFLEISIPILIVILVIFLVFRNYYYSYAARNWPRVDARIVSSRLHVIYRSEYSDYYAFDGDRSRLHSNYSLHKSHAHYGTEILYEYEVDGKVYTCDKVRSFNYIYYSDERKAQRVLDEFPFDRRLKAHVNPDDPEDAIIEPLNFRLFGAKNIN